MKISSVRQTYTFFIVFYALFLIYMMLIGFGRNPGEMKSLQYIPFQTISKFFGKETNFYNFFINIICNIILFFPFGFLGLIFKPFQSIKLLLPVFILAIFFLELIQTITGRGFGEIDDVILNSTGMLIGFSIFKTALGSNHF